MSTKVKYTHDGKKYLSRGEQTISMVFDEVSVNFVVKAAPVEFARTEKETDTWSVSVSSDKITVSFPYKAGTGHREIDNRTGDRIPAEPFAANIMSSIGSDISSFLNLPNDESAALDEIASEWGMDKPSQCIAILRSLRGIADKVNSLISAYGVSLSEFTEWTNSEQVITKEQKSVPGMFYVKLPEILTYEGEVFKGNLEVKVSRTSPETLSTELKAVGDNNMCLSAQCSVFGKLPGDKFFSERSVNLAEAEKIWADIPRVCRQLRLLKEFGGNTMFAGTEKQTAYLNKTSERPRGYKSSVYALEEAGLLSDNEYVYGTAWLMRVIPSDIVAEIEGWKTAAPENADSEDMTFSP